VSVLAKGSAIAAGGVSGGGVFGGAASGVDDALGEGAADDAASVGAGASLDRCAVLEHAATSVKKTNERELRTAGDTNRSSEPAKAQRARFAP